MRQIPCFSAALMLFCALAPAASAEPVADLVFRGGHTVLGNMLGVAGLDTGNVAGDGGVDILVSGTLQTFGGNSHLTLLRADTTSPLGYRQVGFSPSFDTALNTAHLLDLDGDGVDEIVAGFSDGSVKIFQGHAMTPLATLSVPGGVTQIGVADADGNGTTDLVVLSDTTISLFDPQSLAPRGSAPYGASEFAIGDVDGDGNPEFVLVSGQVFRLSREDGNLQTELLWNYPPGDFGIHIGLADIDADGKQELIAESYSDYLTTFNLDIPAPKWQINQLGGLDAMTLADVNGDGVPEAILGRGQWGDVFAIDLTTRQTLWTIDNPDSGVGRTLIDDIDGDGSPDVLWTGGHGSTGGDHLHVHTLPSLALKWRTQHEDGPFSAVALQSGSHPQVAFATSRGESGYEDGFVHQWDATTLQPMSASIPSAFGGFVLTGLHALAYTNGANPALLVGTDRLYDGAIYNLDIATSQVQGHHSHDHGSPICTLALADINGDGEDEIVAGNYGVHTGSIGVYVYLFDRQTGAELWRSINLANTFGGVRSLATGDLDGDSIDDIAAIASNSTWYGGGFLFQFTGTKHTQWQSNDSDYTAVAIDDVDGDGHKEVLAGTTNGLVRIMDGVTHAVLHTVQVGTQPVMAMRLFRDPLSRPYLASLADDSLLVHDLETGELLAIAPHPIRDTKALEVADIEGSGQYIDFFTGGDTAFRAYRLDTQMLMGIFADGLEN